MSNLIPFGSSLARGASLYVSRDIARGSLWLPDSARSMGIPIVAGKGTGKSRLVGRSIAVQDFIRGIPVVIFDPVGGTVDNFLDKIVRLPEGYQRAAWERVLYVDPAGSAGTVVPMPLYYKLGNESLYTVSQRYLDLVRKLDPHLQSASIMGWNSLWHTGTHIGMILAALGLQIIEAPGLIRSPKEFLRKYGPQLERIPEAEPALAFLRDFALMKREERERVSDSFTNKIALFSLDDTMKATFGSSTPGIDWQQVIDRGTAVLFDFRHVLDTTRRRFLMWWYFNHFIEFIRQRGHGRYGPISVIFDELTAMLNFQSLGPDPFLEDLDALINVTSRSHRLWLTICLQQLWQVDPRIAKALLSMGTQILGGVSDPDDGRVLAQHFTRYRPYQVKKVEPVWMSDRTGAYVVDQTTVEFTPEEQEILQAYRFADTGRFRFLVRAAAGEGDTTGQLHEVSIANLDRGIWPDEALVEQVRHELSLRSGIPIDRLLAEIIGRRALVAPRKPETGRGIVSTDTYETRGRDLSSWQEEDEEDPIFWDEVGDDAATDPA